MWVPRAKYTTHTQLPPTFLGMDDLTTDGSFNSQVPRVITVLDLFFDMSSMGVCTTRHLQTSVDWCRNKMSVLYLYIMKQRAEPL